MLQTGLNAECFGGTYTQADLLGQTIYRLHRSATDTFLETGILALIYETHTHANVRNEIPGLLAYPNKRRLSVSIAPRIARALSGRSSI